MREDDVVESVSLVSMSEPTKPARPIELAEVDAAQSAPPTSILAVAEALLQSPKRVLNGIRESNGTTLRLMALAFVSMSISGLVMAIFGGGIQLLLVPLKVSLGLFFCALICFPSLHIFSCLSGAQQSAKETWGALTMSLALMGILLVGFAPIAWVFSQATSSSAFMGTLHLLFLLVSCGFGVGLLQRALQSLNPAPLRGIWMWGALFVFVMLQVSTTLRPLVGPFDGHLFHERLFFLEHWLTQG
jgi:hypothetical protein